MASMPTPLWLAGTQTFALGTKGVWMESGWSLVRMKDGFVLGIMASPRCDDLPRDAPRVLVRHSHFTVPIVKNAFITAC